jgi:hypothetical protein
MPTVGKLLVVLAVALPVVMVGGYAYKKAMAVTWGEALTKAYHVMGNCPGIDITNETSKRALLISNSIYLAGGWIWFSGGAGERGHGVLTRHAVCAGVCGGSDTRSLSPSPSTHS